MEKECFENMIIKNLEKIGLTTTKEKINKFYKYMELLLEWNEKINLTTIIKPEDIVLKHFVDSLTINKYIKENSKVIDVGSGAGFPGIPLKIIRDDVDVVLVDSLNKRINFLNVVIKELELSKIVTIHSRAEELGNNKKYRESFDVSTSRAVANLSTLSEYLIPLVKKGGISINMKGPDVDDEINEAKEAVQILGGKFEEKINFKLPYTDVGRNIIIFKKIGKTPLNYPRKAGIPSKQPIGKK